MIRAKHGDSKNVGWQANADLTGATCRLLQRPIDKSTPAEEIVMSVQDAVNGIIVHPLDPDLAIGTYLIELEATYPGPSVVTFPSDDDETLVIVADLG